MKSVSSTGSGCEPLDNPTGNRGEGARIVGHGARCRESRGGRERELHVAGGVPGQIGEDVKVSAVGWNLMVKPAEGDGSRYRGLGVQRLLGLPQGRTHVERCAGARPQAHVFDTLSGAGGADSETAYDWPYDVGR